MATNVCKLVECVNNRRVTLRLPCSLALCPSKVEWSAGTPVFEDGTVNRVDLIITVDSYIINIRVIAT
jgi:hypothetical protein